MINVYQQLRKQAYFKKLRCGELMIAKYDCPIRDERATVWSESDYLVYVLGGHKTWHLPSGSFELKAGDAALIKRGASMVEQFFDENFCVVIFFLDDEFVRKVIWENQELLGQRPVSSLNADRFIPVKVDWTLKAFYQSLMPYFARSKPPARELLELKFKELLLNILTSDNNREMSDYLMTLTDQSSPSVKQIMETNFTYRFSMEEFARLSGRSLSSFKRDFKAIFGTSPGKWLIARRLDHARLLLRSTQKDIPEVVDACGFENISHFTRVFKARFGLPPVRFRSEMAMA